MLMYKCTLPTYFYTIFETLKILQNSSMKIYIKLCDKMFKKTLIKFTICISYVYIVIHLYVSVETS